MSNKKKLKKINNKKMDDRNKRAMPLSSRMKDFIFLEIIKRHIEEYDEECINKIQKIKESLTEMAIDDKENSDLVFLAGVSDAINFYDRLKNNLRIVLRPIDKLNIFLNKDLFCFFKNLKTDPKLSSLIIDSYDKLLEISNKYNIFATEIIYPLMMDDLINYIDKPDKFLSLQRFRVKKNDNVELLLRNNQIFLKRIRSNIIEDDIDFIKYQFILKRINIEPNTITPFEKYILGLYLWDLQKKYNGKYSDIEFYHIIRNKRKLKTCEGIDCKNCNKRNNDTPCTKFINDARRLASISIKEMRIVHSTTRGQAIRPTKDISVNRRPISFYNPEIDCDHKNSFISEITEYMDNKFYTPLE